ncbi:MAG: cytochrome c3 family protein, partial [Planctomycetota bacterium]
TGNYVVYEGSGTSVRVVNLTPQATYHVAIYEYTGYGTGTSGINYQQDAPEKGSQLMADPPTGHNYTNTLQCDRCHALHSGLVPRDADQITACVDQCHNETGPASSMPMSQTSLHTLGGVDCGGCHEVHNGVGAQANLTTIDTHVGGDPTPALNQSLIRKNVTKYVSTAIEPALYQFKYTVDDIHLAFPDGDQRQDPNGLDDGYDGVCQACHTTSKYHRNDVIDGGAPDGITSSDPAARIHPAERPDYTTQTCIVRTARGLLRMLRRLVSIAMSIRKDRGRVPSGQSSV